MLEMDSDYILACRACRGNTEIEYEIQPRPETYCISITIKISIKEEISELQDIFGLIN